jgi:hypothetical protein
MNSDNNTLTYEPGCVLWYGSDRNYNKCAVLLGYRALVTVLNGDSVHMIMCLSDWLVMKVANGFSDDVNVINISDRDKDYIDRVLAARNQMLRTQALTHDFAREELSEK